MTPSQVAERAAARCERGWCPDRFARASPSARFPLGESVGRNDPRAVKWCPLGAIYGEAGVGGLLGEGTKEQIYLASIVRAAVQDVAGCELLEWNNAPGRTQAEVVAVLRKAAENLKERGL